MKLKYVVSALTLLSLRNWNIEMWIVICEEIQSNVKLFQMYTKCIFLGLHLLTTTINNDVVFK